jgi:tetratricopeptide (TPR) repeat protein
MTEELVAVNTEEEQTRRLEAEETMQEIWSKGQNYLQEKEYDRAIETFSALLETEYADRATDKIAEASQLAAQDDRRRAAELFVLSGKTVDRENRTALLLQSRQLLKGILEKYPQSGLLEKTEKNLERIEEEIRSIDPALLTEPEAAAVHRQSLQNPSHAAGNNIPLGQGEKQVRPVFPHE